MKRTVCVSVSMSNTGSCNLTLTTTCILYVDVNSFKAPTTVIISNVAQFLPVDVGVSF